MMNFLVTARDYVQVAGEDAWQMDPAFLAKLKAMQFGRDRQKLIALGERANLDGSKLSVGLHPLSDVTRNLEQKRVR